MANLALEKWRAKQTSLGLWMNLPDIHVTETAARAGVDWLCFDLQHGLIDIETLRTLLPSIAGLQVNALVRVSENNSSEIGRVLDIGADGVIVPMVSTAKDAENAVSACYYPPLGLRSCGPMRPLLLDGMAYLSNANNDIACIVMIETAEGLSNIESIAAVEGVDALFIGPVDLCFALGITPGDFANPKFVDACDLIKSTAAKYGLATGMFGYSPELAKQALDQGFVFASAGTDISFFRAGLTRNLAIAQGIDPDKQAARAGY